MLDGCHAGRIEGDHEGDAKADAGGIDELWQALTSKAALPAPAEEFLAVAGRQDAFCDNRRAHRRHYLRRRAILLAGLDRHAAYLLDASRAGLGLISPVQLFPRQRVELRVDRNRAYRLEITRCRRRGVRCYECGAVFVLK